MRTLVTAASANPQGMGALVLPQAVDEKEIVRRMMASAEGVLAAAELQKPGKSRDTLVDGTRTALEACAEAHARGLRDGEALGLLGQFPVPGRTFGTPGVQGTGRGGGRGILRLAWPRRASAAPCRF